MRNLIEYPITDQEMVACLKEIAAEISQGEIACGDMRAVLVMTAADIIASYGQLRKKLELAHQGTEHSVADFKEHFEEAVRRARLLDDVAAAAADLITDDREWGQEVSIKMGGHRRIRLADALKALKT